jgi:hypothetical protein
VKFVVNSFNDFASVLFCNKFGDYLI